MKLEDLPKSVKDAIRGLDDSDIGEVIKPFVIGIIDNNRSLATAVDELAGLVAIVRDEADFIENAIIAAINKTGGS